MTIEAPHSDVGHGKVLGNIQSLRGVAALLVVISHIFIIEQKYSPDHVLGRWAELGMIGVDLFFVISGFIMVHVAWTFRRGFNATGEFLFARITRIYPLYWLISLVLLAVYLLRPDMVFSGYDTPPNLVKSFALFPDIRDPLLSVGWTLIHEVGFYVLFAIAILLKPRVLLAFLFTWLFTIIIGQAFGFETHGPVSKIMFSSLTYEFLAGAFTGYIFHKFSGKYKQKAGQVALLLGGLLWLATLFMLISQQHYMIENHLGRAIHFALPSSLVIYGLASIKYTLPKFTQILGDWSYSLYLTHILSLSLLGRIWSKVAQEGQWDNWIILPLLILGSIVIAGLSYKLAERPMLQFTKHVRAKLFR